jgi:hypothetical protein
MKRSLTVHLAMAFWMCAVSSAHAHHSHPYFYDQCRTITIEGQVTSVTWKDPHTVIVIRLDDGTAYTVDWNPLTRLTNTGIVGPARAALVPGSRVTIAGNPIRSSAEIRQHFPDYTYEVNRNTVDPSLIRRVNDSWSWARTPADRMSTSPPPSCADVITK